MLKSLLKDIFASALPVQEQGRTNIDSSADRVIDWAAGRVLAHRVSISMTADFCVEALEEAYRQVRHAGDFQHRQN
jgi:hypothetical protein